MNKTMRTMHQKWYSFLKDRKRLDLLNRKPSNDINYNEFLFDPDMIALKDSFSQLQYTADYDKYYTEVCIIQMLYI